MLACKASSVRDLDRVGGQEDEADEEPDDDVLRLDGRRVGADGGRGVTTEVAVHTISWSWL